jgi:hypothetical protein
MIATMMAEYDFYYNYGCCCQSNPSTWSKDIGSNGNDADDDDDDASKADGSIGVHHRWTFPNRATHDALSSSFLLLLFETTWFTPGL